jgi:hypothetical protein
MLSSPEAARPTGPLPNPTQWFKINFQVHVNTLRKKRATLNVGCYYHSRFEGHLELTGRGTLHWELDPSVRLTWPDSCIGPTPFPPAPSTIQRANGGTGLTPTVLGAPVWLQRLGDG